MSTKVKRRLTTVLCADVAGYTRLMEADEAGTLSTLRRFRTAMTTLVERHDGRVVNTWGDAILAEFPSAVEAVQCAIETQQELSAENGALPEAQQMRFRIGINLGDVMVEGDDIYGEGVNIAARLQELAEPGGILVSGPVYEQVHNKLSIGFDCLGHQQMKNVSNPVMSYRVTLGAVAAQSSGTPSGARRAPGTHPSPARQMPTGLARLWSGYARLPRPIAAALAVSVFLFLINAFSGFHRIWFHWPVTAILLVAVLRTVRGR
jgi:adenylate cyclase